MPIRVLGITGGAAVGSFASPKSSRKASPDGANVSEVQNERSTCSELDSKPLSANVT